MTEERIVFSGYMRFLGGCVGEINHVAAFSLFRGCPFVAV
jgi:hypothetical protein